MAVAYLACGAHMGLRPSSSCYCRLCVFVVHLGEGVIDTRHIEPEGIAGAEVAVGKEYQVVIKEFGLLGTVFILQYAVSAKFLAWDAETEHLASATLLVFSAALRKAGANGLDAAGRRLTARLRLARHLTFVVLLCRAATHPDK